MWWSWARPTSPPSTSSHRSTRSPGAPGGRSGSATRRELWEPGRCPSRRRRNSRPRMGKRVSPPSTSPIRTWMFPESPWLARWWRVPRSRRRLPSAGFPPTIYGRQVTRRASRPGSAAFIGSACTVRAARGCLHPGRLPPRSFVRPAAIRAYRFPPG